MNYLDLVIGWTAWSRWASLGMTATLAVLVVVSHAIVAERKYFGERKWDEGRTAIAAIILVASLIPLVLPGAWRPLVLSLLCKGLVVSAVAHMLAFVVERDYFKGHGGWLFMLPPSFLVAAWATARLSARGSEPAQLATADWLTSFLVVVPSTAVGIRLWSGRMRRTWLQPIMAWPCLALSVAAATVACAAGSRVVSLPWHVWWWGPVVLLTAGFPVIAAVVAMPKVMALSIRWLARLPARLWYSALPWRHPNSGYRADVARRTTRQGALRRLARHDDSSWVRAEAVGRIMDNEFICGLAQHESDVKVRVAAVQAVKDHALLRTLAQTDPKMEIRCAAIARIHDQVFLTHIATHDEKQEARRQALLGLVDPQTIRELHDKRPEDFRCDAYWSRTPTPPCPACGSAIEETTNTETNWPTGYDPDGADQSYNVVCTESNTTTYRCVRCNVTRYSSYW